MERQDAERQKKATAEFMRKVRVMKGQEWYCKECVNFGACNVILHNGEECLEREIEN